MIRNLCSQFNAIPNYIASHHLSHARPHNNITAAAPTQIEKELHVQIELINFPMASIVGVSLSTPTILSKATDSPKPQTIKFPWLNQSACSWKRSNQFGAGRMMVPPVAAAPEGLSEKVADSIKKAEEVCSDDPVSGECVASWDEVEELSAAASHARDKKKESDPLEEYCKDNMDTDECRTYED
ncbi:hypothetical protein LguiB_030404 [Lonicera macranthoides]